VISLVAIAMSCAPTSRPVDEPVEQTSGQPESALQIIDPRDPGGPDADSSTVERLRPRATQISESAVTPLRRARADDSDPRFQLTRGFVVLDDPEIISASDTSAFEADELVLAVTYGNVSRAYPVSMAAYHHIINDEIRGDPLLVTY
jgi:hypothetical protein